VKDGKITADGIAQMKQRMPFSDFTEFDKNPSLESAQSLINVDTIVNYIQSKFA